MTIPATVTTCSTYSCRMDDAEACFILSNRFEVDRIAAVCYFPVL